MPIADLGGPGEHAEGQLPSTEVFGKMNAAESYLFHSTTFMDLGSGIGLIAITMAIRALGMVMTLTVGDFIQYRLLSTRGLLSNVCLLVVASWS